MGYDVVQAGKGKWAVIDRRNGLPVFVGNRPESERFCGFANRQLALTL